MKKLLDFLNRLEEHKIYHRLNKIRDSILVEVAVPGERWEVEFFPDGSVEVEKFISQRHIGNENDIERLFEKFSD